MKYLIALLLSVQISVAGAEVVFNSSVVVPSKDIVEVTIERKPSGFELTLSSDKGVYKEEFAEDGIELKGVILSPQQELIEVLVFTTEYSDVYYSFDL